MKALTFWRPWPDAFLNGGKRVENRKRPPPSGMVGETFAIHAGQRYGLGDWAFPAIWTPPSCADCPTGIVGTARIAGYLDLRNVERAEHVPERAARLRVCDLDDDLWWTGPVGWLLDRVVAIAPVACMGAQGLWTIPEPQLSLVLERMTVATA